MLDTRIGPGEKTPVHTHPWPSVLYILAWSDFVRRDAHGNLLVDSRTLAARPVKGGTLWSAPLGPHSAVNVYLSISSDQALIVKLQKYHADVIVAVPIFGISEPWARFERADDPKPPDVPKSKMALEPDGTGPRTVPSALVTCPACGGTGATTTRHGAGAPLLPASPLELP